MVAVNTITVPTVHCPKCNHAIMAKNRHPSADLRKARAGVLKAKVVFFDERGRVLAKCRGCGHLVPIPLEMRLENDL